MRILCNRCEDRNTGDLNLFLSWRFYDQDLACTLPKPAPDAVFNTATVYKVNVTEDFLNYLNNVGCSNLFK